MEKISAEEFKNRMIEIKKQYARDPEKLHPLADDLMCDVLESLGYDEGIAVFNTMDKWYA